ncbi:ImmA/IrrE family metallo-endopeptidase [Amycolatopsis thermoflava]
MSEAVLAGEVGVDLDQIHEWAAGAEQPSLTEFRALAKALKRSPSFFFKATPPEQTTAAATLRVPYGEKGERKLSASELAHVRSAARRQKIAEWALAESDHEGRPALPKPSGSPAATAAQIQGLMRWNTRRDQIDASSKSAVTRNLRNAIEGLGILTFQIAMGENACRGFSLYHRHVPLIAYNSSGQIAAARTFTLLHELAHILFAEEAICGYADSEHERWCDRFAAAFLIPKAPLEEYLSRYLKKAKVDSDDLDTVRLISNRFKASFQCVALRLVDEGFATWSLYEHVRASSAHLEVERAFSRDPSDTPRVRVREYGRYYPRLVLEAYNRNDISTVELRKYLNVNGEQLSGLALLVSEGV